MYDKRTARFPDTDTAETDAVTIFKYLLDQDHVKFDANERDKIPAVDGDLYLVDETNQITGKLLAQVKKLPDRNRDSPKKRFKIQTLNHYTVDPAPFLIIVVDTQDEIAYWQHIDSEFVEILDIKEDQKTKTIHFTDEQVVDGRDESYIDAWHEITEERLEKVLRQEDFREEFQELRARANPTIGEENGFFTQIHDFLDEYNRLVKDEIPVLNKRLYADSWKIGFALQSQTSESLHYGLYTIPWERNDVQIKEIDEPVFDELDDALVATGHNMENPVLDRPVDYARERVFGKIEDILEEKLLLHGVNRVLAREFVFEFVDEFSDMLGVESGKETYSLAELKRGFYQFLPFWIDEAIHVIEDRDELGVRVGRDGIDLGSLQTRILPEERENIDSRIESRLNEEGATAGPYPVTDRALQPLLFEEFLAYLEQNGIDEVDRLYGPKDYSRLEEQEQNRIWSVYSSEDIATNLEIFFSHLPEAFEDVVEANFSGIAGEVSLFGDYSKVVVTYEISDSYESYQDAPKMQMYYLKGEETEQVDIVLVHEEDSQFHHLRSEKDPGDVVEVDGREYELGKLSFGGMDFLFHETPLLNYVYKKIGEKIGTALEVDDTIVIRLH